MEEPTVEIVMWTTTREETLRKVTKEAMVDEGELSPQVLEEKREVKVGDQRSFPEKKTLIQHQGCGQHRHILGETLADG